ncbi:MAG: hypothetical protein QOG64_3061, partial [Acidimicrobiaceae bacterium]|nr:hypothetical protein [Acidimicrobiaceae bacterium]
MDIQEINRFFVRTSLQAARLPLQAAEAVLHRGDQTDEWPPSLAFDGFEASVKQIVGSVLRDKTLVEEGRLEQAKVAQLRKAAELETLADQRKVEADTKFQQRREADEQRRRQVEQETAQREQKLDQEKAEKKRQADAEAREAEEKARQA